MIADFFLYLLGLVVSFTSIILYFLLKIVVVVVLAIITLVVAIFVLPVWLVQRVVSLLINSVLAVKKGLLNKEVSA